MRVVPVRLIDSDGYTLSLSLGREYEVLGIEADYFRVLNDPGNKPSGNDPVLYAPECFNVVDPKEPEFWRCEIGEKGERYCYPTEWSGIGFFEDYHDWIPEAQKIFWDLLKQYYPETWNERRGKSNN